MGRAVQPLGLVRIDTAGHYATYFGGWRYVHAGMHARLGENDNSGGLKPNDTS